ncbi:MAG: GntR family transcriptional regulator [Corynebacterium sp.]|nr:GntR family transcriptional regulator [Corynebacterium sp.]
MTEQVIEHVQTEILNGRMTPNVWYSVYKLAEQLDMSRSPCRDALLRLEEAGIIQFTKNRGFRVIETTPEDIAQDFAIRLGIEPAAAFRAAKFMTETEVERVKTIQRELIKAAEINSAQIFFEWDLALHDIILLSGKSTRGRKVIDRIRNGQRLLGVGNYPGGRSLMDICHEHQPIVDALALGHADDAADAMFAHLGHSGCVLIRQALDRDERLSMLTEEELDLRTRQIWEEHTLGY